MEREELLYVREHTSCKNYAPDGPIIQIRNLAQGGYLNFGTDHRPFLCFLLRGHLCCRHEVEKPAFLRAAEMCFVARGEIFCGEALEPSVAVLCFLDPTIALCNEYSLKNLSDYLPESDSSDSDELTVLPVNRILLSELDTTRAAIETGLLCIHYQREKRDIFLLMLRGFYSREELAALFRPILSEDFDFKLSVLRIYSPAINVEEMIERSGLPPTSFNRKFLKAFGTTPRRWLVRKKRKSILCDLQMSDLTVKEIALKYGLTPNYFNHFCQLQLGASPHDLRKGEVDEKILS